MGNYYNFYAATAGSGTSTFVGEAPDSICPKGWRMVGNEGEKSFIKLFAEYYGGTHEDRSDTGVNIDTHLLSGLFSFLRSGNYVWLYGGPGDRASTGDYWSLRAVPYAHLLAFDSMWLLYQASSPKGWGYSLRCVASAKLLILYAQKDGEW